ncbi:hypothetical protein MBAV_001334 [Candidatus Magnetobacterium bavaricum]|uniref:Uncharacterized protein n=1 Tax=Candidatus Magnetobacterium bavaricum TaxID=29290 RepID=A0A0F3GX51_9BACT|nr:hypothetical protein MBAV_001334 [Candidatus Magnetobacterium bavaricum]
MNIYRPLVMSLILVLLLFVFLFKICTPVTDRYLRTLPNPQVREFFIDDMPLNMDIVYNRVYSLAAKNNFITFGASTTAEGLIQNMLNLPEGWTYKNFGMTGARIDEYQLLLNLIEHKGGHSLNKTDILIIEILWFHTFTHQYSAFQHITANEIKPYIEFSGHFKVGKNLDIVGEMSPLQRYAFRINYKLISTISILIFNSPHSIITLKNFTWELIERIHDLKIFISDLIHNKPVVVHNKPVVVHNKPVVDNRWNQFNIDDTAIEKFKVLLTKLKNKTNVVVVNQYSSVWNPNNSNKEYKSLNEYNKWLKNDLMLFLSEEGILFVDMSHPIIPLL